MLSSGFPFFRSHASPSMPVEESRRQSTLEHLGTPLIGFSPELITLYVGQTYIPAAAVLAIVSCTYPLVYAAEMLYRITQATARVQAYFIVLIFTGLCKVVLSLTLVWQYGMGAIGAALSSLLVVLVAELVFIWPMGIRMLDLSLGRFARETLFPGWAPAALALVFCFAVKSVVAELSWLVLGAEITSTVFIYLVAIFFFLRSEDREDLARILRRVRMRGTGTV